MGAEIILDTSVKQRFKMHVVFGLVLLMAAGLECGVVKRSMRRVGPPPPKELLSLDIKQRDAVIHSTLEFVKRMDINTQPEFIDTTDELLKTYMEPTLNWLTRGWHLTPSQVQEIQDTGKLCNDKRECLGPFQIIQLYMINIYHLK